MQALHLPGVPHGEQPPYRFPDKPPLPAVLQFSSAYPPPKPPASPPEHTYLISVQYTALTRGELTWVEILDPSRLHPYGYAIPGHDIVGLVTSVFPANTSKPKFEVGDRVWGLLDFDRDGAAAGNTLAYESELAHTPHCPPSTASIKWNAMLATIPLSGLTAHQALFTHASTPTSANSHPARVLVTGATGSVGILTVQIAHATGCEVIALASSKHRTDPNLCKHIDELIPYDDPAFTSMPEYMATHNIPPADVVIDCVGGETLKSILASPGKALKEGGKAITIVAPTDGATFFIVKPNGEELAELGKLVIEGKLVGYVDGVYSLAAGREAMERCESRGTGMGKVVLKVED